MTHRGNDTLSTLEHQPATQRCGDFFSKIVCDFTNVGPRKLPVNHRRKIEFPERMELSSGLLTPQKNDAFLRCKTSPCDQGLNLCGTSMLGLAGASLTYSCVNVFMSCVTQQSKRASLTYGCAILHQHFVSFSGATQHSKRTSLICCCVNIFMYFSCLAQLGFRCTTLVGKYEEDHKVIAMVGYDTQPNLPNLPNRLQNCKTS